MHCHTHSQSDRQSSKAWLWLSSNKQTNTQSLRRLRNEWKKWKKAFNIRTVNIYTYFHTYLCKQVQSSYILEFGFMRLFLCVCVCVFVFLCVFSVNCRWEILRLMVHVKCYICCLDLLAKMAAEIYLNDKIFQIRTGDLKNFNFCLICLCRSLLSKH